jgi:oligopeptide/dipeptide ABC transporter ATP-binding protein
VIRVVDLRVWYRLRTGLFRELLGTERRWVRAVDGVSFDVQKGEVLCLVGESGCGKTSTGRAILKLIEATGGDVFLEVPDNEFQRFREASERPDDPDSRRALDEVRRKYSVTWKGSARRPWRELLWLAVGIAFAAAVALLVAAAFEGILFDPFTDSLHTIWFGFNVGFWLGILAGTFPARPWRRLPGLLAILAVFLVIFGGVPTSYFAQIAGKGIPGAPLAIPWDRDLFGMLLATGLAPVAAAGASAVVLDRRSRSGGLGGIRMQGIRRRLQLIFQDPYESLNPKQSVYEVVSEPLLVNRITRDPDETTSLVVSALRDAGLRPPEEFLFRFPHELSGGQRQRVSIAAALVLQPDFIVADEPVSMLDVSIRSGILQLMMDLRKSRGLTYLFITHDLGLAWVIADRIAVMYLGKIVEIGTAEQVIRQPKHPYTQALISVVPSPDPRTKVDRIILRGERPDPVDIPAGCRFHPRCPLAFERCGWTAEEIAEQLGSLKAAGYLAPDCVIQAAEDGTVQVSPGAAGPDAAVRELEALTKGLRDTYLPLKGIAAVRSDNGVVILSLHASSEPQLFELEPGNSVACHLVGPSETTREAVTV